MWLVHPISRGALGLTAQFDLWFFLPAHLHRVLTIHVSTALSFSSLQVAPRNQFWISPKRKRLWAPHAQRVKWQLGLDFQILPNRRPLVPHLTVLQHDCKHPRCSLNPNSQNRVFNMAIPRHSAVEGSAIFLRPLFIPALRKFFVCVCVCVCVLLFLWGVFLMYFCVFCWHSLKERRWGWSEDQF